MSHPHDIDVERVICSLAELSQHGAHGFTIGRGNWPLRGFVVHAGGEVRGYVNYCPHVGHPLNLLPHKFLSPDGTLILCSSHGALFEKQTGYCVAGPCAGRSLRAVPVEIKDGFVMLGPQLDPNNLPDTW